MTRLDWLRQAAASDTDECIAWPFAHDGNGYGRIQIDGCRRLATHVVLELSGQPRPILTNHYAGSCALHSCDNPPCCNPRHLRWGSQADNMADRSERDRVPVGTRHGRAKLTERVVREVRRRAAAGESFAAIADSYGITKQNVALVVSGRTWRHVA